MPFASLEIQPIHVSKTKTHLHVGCSHGGSFLRTEHCLRTAWVTQQLLGLSLSYLPFTLAVPRPGCLYVLFSGLSLSFFSAGMASATSRVVAFEVAFLTVVGKIKAEGGKEFSTSSCSSLREKKLKASSTGALYIIFFFLKISSKMIHKTLETGLA